MKSSYIYIYIYLVDEILETLEGYQKYLIPAVESPKLRRWTED